MGQAQDTKAKNSTTSNAAPQDDFLNAPMSTQKDIGTMTPAMEENPLKSIIGTAYTETSNTASGNGKGKGEATSEPLNLSPKELALGTLGIIDGQSDQSLLAKVTNEMHTKYDGMTKPEIDMNIDMLVREVNSSDKITNDMVYKMHYLLYRQAALANSAPSVKLDGASVNGKKTLYDSELYASGTVNSTEKTIDKKIGDKSTIKTDLNAPEGVMQNNMMMWEGGDGAVHTLETADKTHMHEWVSADNSEHGSIIEHRENATHTKETDLYDADGTLKRRETVVKTQNEDRAEALKRKKEEAAKKLEQEQANPSDPKSLKEKIKENTEVTTKLVEVQKDWNAGIGKEGKAEKHLGGGVKASAEGELSTLKADAKAGVYYDPKKGLKVGGSAGAKYTLAGGNAKITAGPYGFNLGGEKMQSEFTVGVSAAVLAEANGELNINAMKSGEGAGLKIEAGSEGKVSAFAGGKAGVEAGAKLDWGKQADYRSKVESYTRDLIREYLGSYTDYVPDFMFGEFAEYFASIVIGEGGWKNLAAVKGGLEGTAGIGGEAAYNLGLSGGRIKCSGKLQGTVGLGLGGKVSVDLDALDGVRFVGMMLFNGADYLLKKFGIAPSTIMGRLRKKTDQAMAWLGKQIYDYGTSGYTDYLIPDSVASYCAKQLGYSG